MNNQPTTLEDGDSLSTTLSPQDNSEGHVHRTHVSKLHEGNTVVGKAICIDCGQQYTYRQLGTPQIDSEGNVSFGRSCVDCHKPCVDPFDRCRSCVEVILEECSDNSEGGKR